MRQQKPHLRLKPLDFAEPLRKEDIIPIQQRIDMTIAADAAGSFPNVTPS